MATPTTTISFRIAKEKVQALAQIADLQDRDRSYVLNEAVDYYLALNEIQTKKILEGVRQADAGQAVSHDDALAHFAAHRAKHLKQKL